MQDGETPLLPQDWARAVALMVAAEVPPEEPFGPPGPRPDGEMDVVRAPLSRGGLARAMAQPLVNLMAGNGSGS